MPYYVPPEQVMADRAEYARKGIARGRSLVALIAEDGILLCAENPSETLHKINEIYDRIAFGGVGKFNEFDQLRVAGVRHADLKGYEFSRADVEARSLANQYAQLLGNVFTHEMKPMEVELLVAEIAAQPEGDRLFHVLYDGTMVDEQHWCVLGGDAATVSERVEALWRENLDLANGLAIAVRALSHGDNLLEAAELEVACLQRGAPRRTFRRWTDAEVTSVLTTTVVAEPNVSTDVSADASPDASPDVSTNASPDAPTDGL